MKHLGSYQVHDWEQQGYPFRDDAYESSKKDKWNLVLAWATRVEIN